MLAREYPPRTFGIFGEPRVMDLQKGSPPRRATIEWTLPIPIEAQRDLALTITSQPPIPDHTCTTLPCERRCVRTKPA